MYPENKTPILGLCFVDDGLTYILTFTNYSQVYIDHIIDSFRFLETSRQQQDTTENISPEVLKSIAINPLSSIYSDVILS